MNQFGVCFFYNSRPGFRADGKVYETVVREEEEEGYGQEEATSA